MNNLASILELLEHERATKADILRILRAAADRTRALYRDDSSDWFLNEVNHLLHERRNARELLNHRELSGR